MKEQKYLVQSNKQYLDGYDGENYEWTNDRKKAWRLSHDDAARKCLFLQRKQPHLTLKIIEA
jgi:hypothetical protein